MFCYSTFSTSSLKWSCTSSYTSRKSLYRSGWIYGRDYLQSVPTLSFGPSFEDMFRFSLNLVKKISTLLHFGKWFSVKQNSRPSKLTRKFKNQLIRSMLHFFYRNLMAWCKVSTKAVGQLHPVQILTHTLQYSHFNYGQSSVNKHHNPHSPSSENILSCVSCQPSFSSAP